MNSYYDRWLMVKSRAESDSNILKLIRTYIEDWVGYRSKKQMVLLGEGINHLVFSVGEIEIPERKLYLALRVPKRNDTIGVSLEMEIISFANAVGSTEFDYIPFFGGIVSCKIENLRPVYAMLTEDLTENRKLYLSCKNECRFGFRTLENGIKQRIYVDPEPDISNGNTERIYLKSKLIV